MLLSLRPTAFALSLLLLLLSSPTTASPSDLPSDIPVSQILQLASSALSAGSSQDALAYYDIAVSRDPSNYLTIFKRGATQLSLGRQPQALADFDRVLTIKPNFEGALSQRAKIRSRNADWKGARADYAAAGKVATSQEVINLSEAEKAEAAARAAEKAQKWDECVAQAGEAIMVASSALELRRLRAACRMQQGEIEAAMQDLRHVLQIDTGATALAAEISATTFYALGDVEKGLESVRRCLHSDPENRVCGRLTKREKKVEREVKRVKQMMEKRTFSGAVKALVPSANGEEKGLIGVVEDDLKEYKEQGLIPAKAPENLRIQLLEMTCDAFIEMNNHKRGANYCTTLLTLSPTSRPALFHLARSQYTSEDYDAALRTLQTLKEHHPHLQSDQKWQKLVQDTQGAIKRAKQKDYYKVLDVDRSASAKEIKRAYLKLSKLWHPDKAPRQEDKLAYEKKMAGINEAYEVLSDEEVRRAYDEHGIDPNNPESQQGPGGHGNPFQQGMPVFRQGSPFGGGGGGMPNFGGGMPNFGGGGFQFKFN